MQILDFHDKQWFNYLRHSSQSRLTSNTQFLNLRFFFFFFGLVLFFAKCHETIKWGNLLDFLFVPFCFAD